MATEQYLEGVKNASDFAVSKPIGIQIGCNCGGEITFRTDNSGSTPAVGSWWLKFIPGAQGSDTAVPHKSFTIKVQAGIPVTWADPFHLPEGTWAAIHDTPNDPNAGYLHYQANIRAGVVGQ